MQKKIDSVDLVFRGYLSKVISRTSDLADFYQIHFADLGFEDFFSDPREVFGVCGIHVANKIHPNYWYDLKVHVFEVIRN